MVINQYGKFSVQFFFLEPSFLISKFLSIFFSDS